MAKLVYVTIMSLDGYTADESGGFEWSTPDPEVFRCISDLEREFGTYLLGRKMYETMVYWETFPATGDQPPAEREFGQLWRAASKVVYSRTLDQVSSGRTRIERAFDATTVQRLKETAGHDLSVAGPELAGQALAAGLVDELHLFVTPVIVGGGTAALPQPWRTPLALLGLDRFASGVVRLHYRIND